MHEIDSPTAVSGAFVEGDPLIAQPATRLTADWFNAVQSELVNLVEGMGGVLDKPNNSQVVEAVLRAAAQGAGGNALFNPDFRIWQRFGVVPAADTVTSVLGYRGPDRWMLKAGQAGELASVSQVQLVNASEISPSRTPQVLRYQKGTAAGPGAEVSLLQRVEDARTFQASRVVVAFDAKKNSGSDLTILGVDLTQHFGAGGSADVVTTLTATAGTTIDGNWRRLVFVGDLPSTFSKTIVNGAGIAHRVEVKVRLAQAVTFDVYLTAFVFARAAADPGFVARQFTQELALCQRYFETSALLNSGIFAGGPYSALWDTDWPTTGDIETFRRYVVPKYEASAGGSTRWYSPSGATDAVREEAAGPTLTDHAVTTSPTQGTFGYTLGVPRLTTPPAGGVIRKFRANFVADYEIN